ncbi:MAG: uncharacterized protein JWN79_867 [Gemmatimonadetes bacterium]|jgi:uncharacterized protein YkwD|nr:uncharacterized protein [Gemmatimonadota bacterium]
MRSSILIAFTSLALLSLPACSRSTPESRPAPAPARRTTTSTRPAAPPGPTKANAEAWADELITRTNAERRNARLTPLTRSINLMRAAELQAAQMARVNVMEHDIPGAAYPTLASRLAYVKYPVRAAGENIGEGYRSPAEAVAGWMASSGHRANILSASYTEIGTAMAPGPGGTVFWVQVFGRPR